MHNEHGKSERQRTGTLDHDLVILQQAVDQHSLNESHTCELEALNGLIDERQRELEIAALALGKRFYAESPSAFCNRLAGYWQIWRGETKPPARLAVTPP